MRSLSGILLRVLRGGHGERGAVAVVVATLLAGGVIMGMLAVSVDLGNIMYERRQVQNGADATSLALAGECAADSASCDPAKVEDLLGANARDAAGQYDSRTNAPNGACARGEADQVGPLAAVDCASAAGGGDIADLGECPPLPQWLLDEPAIPYVETYSATETSTGDDELFLPFSRVLAGGASGDAGLSACARAAWGLPAGYSAALPITISSCEWQTQTAGGTDYVADGPVGAKPGYGGSGQPAWPDSGREVVIELHTPQEEDTCTWNGKDTAGGFGWLDSGSTCETAVSEDDWVHIDTGNNVPEPCKDTVAALHETVIEIPVFDCIVTAQAAPTGEPPTTPAGVCDPTQQQSSGNNSYYHLAGWAKFYVSGYYLSGSASSGGSSLPGGQTCSGSERCLSGWFLTGALSDAPGIAAPGSGTDFGTYVVKPAG